MSEPRKAQSRLDLITEAIAIEQGGGLWEAKHIAALYPLSVRSVPALAGLPRTRVPLTGTRRQRIGYPPREVRAFFAARQSHSVIPGERRALRRAG